MKLAIVVTIGRLDCRGYQRTAGLCLDNLAGSADRIYFICSHPVPAELPAYPNGVVVCDEKSRFEGGRFDVLQIAANERRGLEAAKDDGMDAGLSLVSNSYIPPSALPILRDDLEWMIQAGEPFEWVYFRYQFGARLAGASAALPKAVNLHRPPLPIPTAHDGLQVGEIEHRGRRGDFSDHNLRAVVDTNYEVTWADIEEKLNYVRCYVEHAPHRSPVFSFDYWHDYYLKKVGAMLESSDQPEGTGELIAQKTSPDYIGNLIYQELGR